MHKFHSWFALIPLLLSLALYDQPQIVPVLQAQAPIGEFVANCPLSHRAHDDPILFPGQAGAAHLHEFFGSTTTDENSTVESLLAGGTTCNVPEDRSAYWIPTLYNANDTIIAVERTTFYYTVSLNDPMSLQPYPIGIKIIAGHAKATMPPEMSHFKWSCLASGLSSTQDFVVCPEGSRLELLLNFPDCWDGHNLDSVDHMSHMAYSAAGACPTSHPVPVPILQFKIRYATRGSPGMYLSSGAGYTVHGDFFNAWEQQAMENRTNCLRLLLKCGPQGLSVVYLPHVRR
jgi:hypothetical protein